MSLKTFFIIVLSLLSLQQSIFSAQLILKKAKDLDHSLSSSFLQEMVLLFNTDVFIESGTFLGNTTAKAIPFFKEVHSIELSNSLYNAACQRFKYSFTTHIHNGNSSEVLAQILPHIKGKILFWLDGHYSEGITAKGEKNTPLLDELEAIRLSGIKNAVILVDDIRQFQQVPDLPHNEVLKGFPNVKELRDKLMSINENYVFTIYGDIAIAFDKNEDVIPSPVLSACTISRMLEDKNDLVSINTILEAEKIICQATSSEQETLLQLPEFFKHSEMHHGLGKYFHLWSGLIFMGLGNNPKAYKEFKRALELGCFKEHIAHYLP